jgi:hypothetical protein
MVVCSVEHFAFRGWVMPQSARTAADIWQTLRSKRGPELLNGLVDELAELHQLCRELGRRLEQLQIQQNFPGHLFALEDASNSVPRLPTRVDIDASQLLEPQHGFHNLEYDDNRVPFRWTGPQRHFSFRVNIDRETPLVVELDVLWMMDEPRQRDLELLVDGSLLPFHLDRSGSGLLGRAVLPPAGPEGTTTLTFIVPCTLRLAPGGADQRELGIAFRKLKIRPAGSETSGSETSGARAAGAGDAGPVGVDDTLAAGPTEEAEVRLPSAATVRRPRDRNPDEMLTDSLEPAPPLRFSCTAAELDGGHPGFYGLERDDNGIPFRWTGRHSSPSFSFSVPIDRRTAVELELKVMSAIDRRRQSPLRLEVDGAEYAVRLRRAGDHLEGRLVIPPRAAAGPTLLTFTVPALLRPGGSDQRELGIAFGELHLRPVPAAVPPDAAGWEPSPEDDATHAAGRAAAANPTPMPQDL